MPTDPRSPPRESRARASTPRWVNRGAARVSSRGDARLGWTNFVSHFRVLLDGGPLMVYGVNEAF